MRLFLLPLALWAHCAVASPPAGLVEVFAAALQHNPERQIMLANSDIRGHQRRAALGELLPDISLIASYDYRDEEIEGVFYALSNIYFSDDYDSNAFGIRLSQPLYQPALLASLDIATLNVERARAELIRFDDELVLSVAQAYFGVLAGQDAVRLREAEIAKLTQQVDQVRGLAEAGLQLEAEVMSAEASLAIAEAGLIRDQGLLEAAFAKLDAVTGQRFRTLRKLPAGMVINEPDPPHIEPWVEHARSQNLAVVLAEMDVQLSELGSRRERGSQLPSVHLQGGLHRLDNNGGAAGERMEHEARIGVNLSWSLPSLASQGRLAAARAQNDRADAALASARAEAEHQVKLAFTSLRAAYAQVPAYHKAVKAARAAEQAMDAGYRAGTRTNEDALGAIAARYDAERHFASARYEYMLSSLRLSAAAGLLSNAALAPFDNLLNAN